MIGDRKIIVRFEQIFAVQAGKFVPKLDLSVGGTILEKGEPVDGNTSIHGAPLYALMERELLLERLFDGVVELYIVPDSRDSPLKATGSG
jgi:hypothetical protein